MGNYEKITCLPKMENRPKIAFDQSKKFFLFSTVQRGLFVVKFNRVLDLTNSTFCKAVINANRKVKVDEFSVTRRLNQMKFFLL